MIKALIISLAIIGITGLAGLVYSHGMRGYGVMGHWGYGHMGGMAGHGMMGSDYCPMIQGCKRYYGTGEMGKVTEKDAQKIAQDYLSHLGNPYLKQGKLVEKDSEFEIQIVTKDNSLVEKLLIDKQSGWTRVVY